MVEVIFKAQDIAELKLMIQEYSLAHLGLTPKELVTLRQPIAKPGVSLERKLDDGTTRLHNPKYPSRAPNAEEAKRKPGRPRKDLPIEPGAAEDVPLVAESPTAAKTTETVAPGSSYERARAKDAIHQVNKIKGFGAAMAALEHFGAKHLNDVSPERYDELINYCAGVINGDSGPIT